MPIQTITTDVQLQIAFLATDERGDVTGRVEMPGYLRAVTPLHVMGLYEQLHAQRNDVRRQAGLPEIATPDEGVLVLAFLRCVKEMGATSLRELVICFDDVVKTLQENRLEEATEPANPWRGTNQGPSPAKPWICPSCHAANDWLKWEGGEGGRAEADCPACGAKYTYQGWLLEQARVNGQEPAEVTG